MFSGIAAMAAGVARLKAQKEAAAREKERKADLRREALEALKRGGPEGLERWAKSRGVALGRAKKPGGAESKPGPWSEDPDESKKARDDKAAGAMGGMSPVEVLAALDYLEAGLDRISGRPASKRALRSEKVEAVGEEPAAEAPVKRKILGSRKPG